MPSTEIDGVPVFWQDAPGPLRVGLEFGCGARDETFLTIGVTRLVAGLVRSPRPGAAEPVVTLATTRFHATGPPEQAAAFLRDVCQAVSDPPWDRRTRVADELATDGRYAVHPTAAVLLSRRFGPRDAGLESYAGPGPHHLSPETIREHLDRFFVAENAALWLTGPPPDGLRLPLPRGIRPRRSEPVPVAQAGPRWSYEAVPAPGVLLAGDRDPAWTVALAVARDRIAGETPPGRNAGYQVSGATIQLGQTSYQYLLSAQVAVATRAGTRIDSSPTTAGVIAEVLWGHLRRLAGGGPTGEELAGQRAAFAETIADPQWSAVEAAGQARASLVDGAWVTAADRRAEVDAVTGVDVQRCLGAALSTALLAVPPGAPVLLAGVGEGGCPRSRALPYGEAFTMKPLVRRLARDARPPTLYLTPDGLARLDPDGWYHETTFADVIGVAVNGRNRMVYAASGCVFPLVGDAYRDGDVLVEAIDAAVAPEVRFAALDRPLPPPRAGRSRWRRRGGWFRLLNALGAIGFGLATLSLYLDYRDGDSPLWVVMAGGLVTLWCAWEALPRRRRRRPHQRRTAMNVPSP